MRDALRGRWHLSGDPFCTKPLPAPAEDGTEHPGPEAEGDVYLETEGVTPRYIFKMQLSLATAGRGAKNNKLNWKGYWSYNRLADDWAEFGLKNDRPFYWSRVRSYATPLQLPPASVTS